MDCNKVNIKNGSKGEQVKQVQKYLEFLGYYDGRIDGNCGSYTVSAIKSLQKSKGLKVDGNFGPLTCQSSGINGTDISNTSKTIDKGVWKNIMQRYEDYKKKNGCEPNICYININTRYEYITNTKYKDIKSRYDKYIKDNKSEPNFVYINKTTTTTNNNNTTTSTNLTYFKSEPHYTGTGCNNMGQCTPYYCGVHALRQVLRKFGITDYTESTLAGWAGTTTAGTSHGGINTALKRVNSKKGTNFSIKWINFSDLGNTTSARFKELGRRINQSNTDCIIHNLYRNKYGHYECIHSINTKTSTVQVLNSLGTRTGNSYLGYIENRGFSTFQSYISNTPGGQASVALITKN